MLVYFRKGMNGRVGLLQNPRLCVLRRGLRLPSLVFTYSVRNKNYRSAPGAAWRHHSRYQPNTILQSSTRSIYQKINSVSVFFLQATSSQAKALV